MTISFSGLASGLDTSGWVDALVSVKQQKVTELQTKLTAIQSKKSSLTDTRSTFNALRTALEKITDKKFGGTFDLFGKSTATSSNNDIFTATAVTGAPRQSYDIAVQQLATYTKAVSKESASAVADDSTKLSNMGITAGTFTVFVDGVKTSIEIDKDDTLGNFKSRLAEVGISTNIDEDGVLRFSAQDPTQDIRIGTTTDTSNLFSLVGLSRQDDGSYASTNSLFKASLNSKLIAEDSGFNEQITAGTFVIGNATFTIGSDTTLSSLIYQINNSDEAQANAFWDDATGKLTITSKKEGASYINIEAGTSNFTDVMGLTETTRDGEGNVVTSKMYTEAQELGLNALFTINGTNMISTSNTVSSDISRIEGVTLTLKKVSTEEDGTTTLSVEQDSSGLLDAVRNFVNAYNDTIAKIDEVTGSGADLQRESSLTSFRSTIRNYALSSNTTNGGDFKLLSEIGITTAQADGNNLSTDTSKLQLDEDAFLKALQENPSSVEELLGGEFGILNQMESAVEQTLQASTGFFDIKQSNLDSEVKRYEDKISKQKTKINNYKTQLEAKFGNMELLIAQMQQNYSSFLTS